MKSKLLLGIILLLSSDAIFCQPIAFQKVYPGPSSPLVFNNEIIQTADNGYITGNIAELLKTDSVGKKEWMKKIMNGSLDMVFSSVTYTQSGLTALASYSILKLNNNYNILWTKKLTGLTGIGISSGLKAIRETSDKGFIICGGFNMQNPYPNAVYGLLIKTDSLGSVQWSKTYHVNTGCSFVSLLLTPDGGYMISAMSDFPSTTFGAITVIKTDSLGNSQWAKDYFAPNTFSYSYHITASFDSNYVLAISRYPHKLLLKIDVFGNKIWEKYYEAEINGTLRWVEETKDKGLISVGEMEGNDSGFVAFTCFLMKTDSSGNLEWARELGGYGDTWAGCVKQTADGGYVISAREHYNGNDVIAIIKTDSLGHTNGCMEGTPIVTVTNINDTVINVPVTDSIINVTSVTQIVNPPLVGSEITVCAPLGIQEISNEYTGIIFYPNPNNGNFSIASSFHPIENIRISDLSGRLILSNEKISKTTYNCKLNAPDGIYIVEIFVNGNTYRNKIVIYH